MEISKLRAVNLHLEKDPHAVSYETVEQYLETSWGQTLKFLDGEKEKAIATGHLWTFQWYPHTPIGFYVIAASSLEAIEEYLKTMVEYGKPKDRVVKQ